ncbi:MAG: hypothetical protein JW841_09930 [Deltaproteobacteria bacterium]|nr:hypothetical protein [Deltaproteobacteria bacterium]
MSRIQKFARSFPSLKAANGVKPWQPQALARWACNFNNGTLELNSARFVLWVADPFTLWPCGRFNLFEAIITWDAPHRLAFIAWIAAPWWL